MSSDRYTRIVLTVIAVCLVWMVARDVEMVKQAHAAHAASTMEVEVVKWTAGRIDVEVDSWTAGNLYTYALINSTCAQGHRNCKGNRENLIFVCQVQAKVL